MSCAICSAPVRGFGWTDPRWGIPFHQQRERADFCSARCLDTYTTLMKKLNGPLPRPTDLEHAAMCAALPPLGDAVTKLGVDRPLAMYSREEILDVVAVVVGAYRTHIADEYARLAQEDEDALARRFDPRGSR